MKNKIVLFFFFIVCLSFSTAAQNMELANKMFYYEKYELAKSELEKQIALQKEDANAYYLLTLCHLMKGNNAAAMLTAQKGLSATQNNPLIQVVLGHIYLADGKKEEARQQFETALKGASQPSKNSLLIAIGRAHGSVSLKNSVPEYGINKLDEAALSQPNNADIFILLGDCYRRRLDDGNAILNYRKASAIKPTDARVFYKTGHIYKIQDNCDALKSNFIEATAIDANFMPAWRALYETYSNIDSRCYDLKEAKIYLDKYAALAEPGFATDLLKMNFCYTAGDYSGALKNAADISSRYPAEAETVIPKWKAFIYRTMNDSVNAIKSLEEYFTKEKNSNNIDATLYNMLAELYSKFSGQEKKAIESYKKYQATETTSIKLLRSYTACATLAARTKDFMEAALWYKKIIDAKEMPSALDYYQCGFAYFNGGEYTTSADIFKLYENKYPADWRAPYWAAKNYAIVDSTMKQGTAVPYYEKFVPLGEKDPQAKTSLITALKYLFVYQFNIKRDKIAATALLNKLKQVAPGDKAIPEFEKYLTTFK